MNQEQISRLEGAVLAAPADKKALAQAALDIAKAAASEIETLRKRAELAELTTLSMRPYVEKIREQAEAAEERADLIERDAVAKAAEQKIIKSKEQEQTDRVAVARAMVALEKTIQGLAGRTGLLVACAKLTRDAEGRSLLQNGRKHARFEVLDPSTGVTKFYEGRDATVDAVLAIIEKCDAIEAEKYASTDAQFMDEDETPGRPTVGNGAPAEWQGSQEERSSGGVLDGRRFTKKRLVTKRQARLL
jgi:hypothetical protein